MKLGVSANLFADIAGDDRRLAALQDHASPRAQPRGEVRIETGALGGSSRGKTVERGTDVVVMADEVQIERRDVEAPLSKLLDHPVGLEKRHRLLNRLARHPELCRELLLHQMGARPQRAAADLVHDGVVDLLRQARWGGRKLHSLNSEF